MHTYEMDSAGLGGDWDGDEVTMMNAVEAAWQAHLPDVDVNVCWADTYNGGRGLVCSDPAYHEEYSCPHVTEATLTAILEDAWRRYEQYLIDA